MDPFQLHYQQQKESIEKILYNVREATELEVMANTLDFISKLCQGQAEVKLTQIQCKLCLEAISGRDEELFQVICECKQKSLNKDIFHNKCFLKYCLAYGKTNFKCKNDQCFQNKLKQIETFLNIQDFVCQICNQTLSNNFEDTVKTGCECPFKRVHKECLSKQYRNFQIKQHQVLCQECNSYFREENVIQCIQNYQYGCTTCYNQASNHIYWDCVPIDCHPYMMCRICYENFNFNDLDFSQQLLNQIRCHHQRDCNKYLSYHSLNQYFNKLEKVENKQKAQEILSKGINLENYFDVAKCPGYILKPSNKSSAYYKYLQQSSNTHYILYGCLFDNRELEEASYDLDDDKVEIVKCQNTFEADVRYQMQRCSNCNYKFCYKCQLPHFGIPCSVFKNIKNNAGLTEESFLESSSFGQNTDDHRPLLLLLDLDMKLFQLCNQVRFNNENTQNLQLQNNQLNYYFNYPNRKDVNVIQINIQYLYGQQQQNYDSWLCMYLPILSIEHLKQCIRHGIERNATNEISQMTDKYKEQIIQNGTILYSEYEYALDISNSLPLSENQTVKIVLLCKAHPESIKKPLSYQSLYVSNQTLLNDQSQINKDQNAIIAFQILVFKL
ncbi:hypothetical protein TTHERM_00077670 (macronuclear) [Tetrahymena thermophila SB210]|uniref:Uncharacterized protein n=1 Tax=Tetrahymena thermophila (strain SB210) TaxID=312017 RepID=Q23FZ7_TETTS|nr:hypothetical protein TTHERM_00077670 [Tetrahymena thermophila SB210]EAR95463.2 hypothetical protein TTHERM_00077670 [Tetrahymena thermophila SB210]|eukprot:XP_001015708.2 hypothetical protein TTHERM_00077670 [Tetrahymena thermophila SB210]